MAPTIPEPHLEFVAHVHVELGPIESLGVGLDAERRFVAITGGTIRGDQLNATIDSGGADWQTVHADGAITVDTRYSATTHDGAKLLIATRGIRRGDRAVLDRLAAGEPVEPREYYFRVVADIQAAGVYRWLSQRVHVGTATRSAAAVDYDLYAVA
jgi:hypothetical protein